MSIVSTLYHLDKNKCPSSKVFPFSCIFFCTSFTYLFWAVLFFFFLLCRVFCSCCEQSLLFVGVHGLLLAMASLVADTCVCAQQLWPPALTHGLCHCNTGLVAPQQCAGSSWIKDQAHVCCISRWILYHRATREVPHPYASAN